jgi:hypothetical protein
VLAVATRTEVVLLGCCFSGWVAVAGWCFLGHSIEREQGYRMVVILEPGDKYWLSYGHFCAGVFFFEKN